MVITELIRGPGLLMLLEKMVALGPAILGSGEQIIKCCGLVLFLATTPSSHVVVEEEQKVLEMGGGDTENTAGAVEELASVVLGLLGVLLEMGEEERAEVEEKAFR